MDTKSLISYIVPQPNIVVSAGSMQMLQSKETRNVHAIYLHFETAADTPATDAAIDADVTSITIKVGERIIVDAFTPAELRAIYGAEHAREGAYAANGGSIAYVAVNDRMPRRQARFHRLGMLSEKNPDGSQSAVLSVEVTWAAGPLTIVTCKPLLVVDDDEKGTIGHHFEWSRFRRTNASTGWDDIDAMFVDKTAVAVAQVWFPTGVGTLRQFTVKVGSVYRYDQAWVEDINRENSRGGIVAQTGYQILAFDQNKDPSSLLVIKDAPSVIVSPRWSVAPGAHSMLRKTLHIGG